MRISRSLVLACGVGIVVGAVSGFQARIDEIDKQQSAATEQARWNELNAQLDELERQLGPLRR